MPSAAPRPAPALVRLAAVALLALGLLLSAPADARAHTGLRATEPAADSTVTTTPAAVTLTFTASVLDGEVTVTGPDGAPVGTAEATVDGAVVTAPVALTAAGRHTVTWSVTSPDGHVLDGTFAFDHAPATPLPTSVSPSPTPVPSPTTTTPTSATSAPTTRPSGSATDDDGTPAWLLPGIGAVAVAGAVAGGVVIGRRRR